MKRSHCFLVLVCVLVLGIGSTLAQSQASMELPKVIWLYHETVKPAKNSTHDKVESGFARVWAKANVQPCLGMQSVSSTNETLFISGYDSFGTFETDYQIFNKPSATIQTELGALQRQEADLISEQRSVVAVLQKELSYNADRFMQGLPKSRYFEVLTMRVGHGKDEDFSEVCKFYRTAFEKANSEQPFATYRVMYGSPGHTFLIFLPLQSLKSVDEMMAMEPRMMQAMGEDQVMRMKKIAGESLIWDESNLYVFNPKISHVSAEFASADPAFWGARPRPAEPAVMQTTKNRGK
jgi:hypothetical protein